MSREDIAQVLETVRLFRGADSALFKQIAQQPRARRPSAANELVYEAGDPADAIFVAFPADPGAVAPRGIVELVLPTDDAGLRAHVEHVVAGDAFGEFEFVAAGLIAGRTIRRSSARTIVACDLYRIPFTLLAPVVAEVEAIRGRLIRLSMERLISALSIKTTHLLGDRDIALANWLLDAADNIGIAEGRHVRFSRPLSQRAIAEALGVSRETISLRLNEWERAGLLNTGGQSRRFEILDYPRVALRAGVRKQDAVGAIDAALAEIDDDLDRGELVRARNVALDVLNFFPASPELRHRVALANIRAGAVRQSVDVLVHGGYATGGDIELLRDRVGLGLRHPGIAPARLFGGAEPLDADDSNGNIETRTPMLVEDLAAIEARAHKEMAFAADDIGSRRRHAVISAHSYERIFDATGGTYAGINAATMATVAGERKHSAIIARRIVAALGADPEGYWPNATLGEAHLLLGDEATARKAFAAAVRQKDVSDGKLSSTHLQIRRIGANAAVATESILAELPIGRIAVYSGRLFRHGDLDAIAQKRLEATIRPRIAAALKAGNFRYLFGNLACGADILFAEAALATGCELHVILPFPVEAFIETSVSIGNPPEGPDRWTDRFWSCLNRSTSLVTAIDSPPRKRSLDADFYHALRLAAGLALLKADMLTSNCTMLAASGGHLTGNTDGTSRAVREWVTAGRELVETPLGFDLADESGSDAADPFAPVVFLWPLEPSVDLASLCDAAAASTGCRFDISSRTSRDRRPGVALVLRDIKVALGVAAALARHCSEAKASVRIVADFGPALDAHGQINETLVSRLSAASDLIGFPAGVPIATMAFATQARLEAADRITLVPIGRTAPAPASSGRALATREAYAMSFVGERDAI